MKKRFLLVLFLILSLLLAGCQENVDVRPEEPEPTAVYDWMAGESPVPNQRSGLYRAGVNNGAVATSPAGVYYVSDVPSSYDSYIWYVDHGSDTIIKLCGRADCTHATPDCNAYVFDGNNPSYYGGYLYAVSGGGGSSEECKLIRMDPDGSNRVTLLDLQAYVKEHDGDYAQCDMITDGICLFSIMYWKDTGDGRATGSRRSYCIYKLDGSLEEPKAVDSGGMLYSCGDVILTYSSKTKNGGEYGSYWDWDPETDTLSYLTDHPGVPGWYGADEAYYFKDGGICRLTYATQTEEVLVNTGLEGKYYLFSFPDCLVLSCRENDDSADDNLYIYNWNFELVDTVNINYSHSGMNHQLLIAETAERFILTNSFDGKPMYYINKSELGTGNAQIHSFVYD